MNIGEELKKAREGLGIDQRYVSEMTHIRREYIIALEENRFEDIRLAPVYRIGFLRIYSKYLKLNSDAVVAEFKAQFGAKTSGKGGFRVIPAAAKVGGNASDSLLSGETDIASSADSAGLDSERKRLAIVAGAVVLVLLVGALVLVKACSAGSSSATGANAGEIATAAGEENLPRAYRFTCVSNTMQRVKIYENYTRFDREAKKPIHGARVVDQLFAKDKEYTLTGRGTLYVEEEVRGGLTLTLPNQAVIDSAPAGSAPVELPADPALRTSPKSTERTTWLATPKK